jgi:hypothetical protein
MSGQVQFDGKVPFTDKRTGAQVEVRVWGTFVGQGIDAHEQQPIREWIINALATSAAAYEGDVQQLAQMGQEWGAYVSQQIAPNLARYFQVQGNLQVHGVQVLGAAAPAPAASPYAAPAAQPVMSAPVPAPAPVAKAGAAPMASPVAKAGAAPSSSSLLEAAQAALVQRMGASPDLARQAAMIVLEVVEAHRGADTKAAPVGAVSAGYAKDPGQAGYAKDAGAAPPAYSGGYGKDPAYSGDPGKGGYGGDPWKK